MEEIVYLMVIIVFSIILFDSLKKYVGIEGMTLTEDQKRDLEKSKITNAKPWHYGANVDVPKQEKEFKNLENTYNKFKKTYDLFLKEEDVRTSMYDKIYKIAYPEEEGGDGEEEDREPEKLCEKTPRPGGCGKMTMKGDYKKVQDEILVDDADPEKDQIPSSLKKWTFE